MTSNLVISIKEGKVKGIIKKNFDGGEFISFQGIPYAKSPLGNLRFKVRRLIYIFNRQITLIQF